MREWQVARRDWIYIEFKGAKRKLKLHQYVRELEKQLPKVKSGNPPKLVNHYEQMKVEYCKGDDVESCMAYLNDYCAKVINADYVKKSGYFWETLKLKTRIALQQYLEVDDVFKHRIDIIMPMDMEEFKKFEGVEESIVTDLESMIKHITGVAKTVKDGNSKT